MDLDFCEIEQKVDNYLLVWYWSRAIVGSVGGVGGDKKSSLESLGIYIYIVMGCDGITSLGYQRNSNLRHRSWLWVHPRCSPSHHH